MKTTVIIILASVAGLVAGIACFQTLIWLINKFALAKIINSKSNLGTRINDWWDSAINLKPQEFLKRSIQPTIDLINLSKERYVTILFFTVCFVIFSALVGIAISVPFKISNLCFDWPNNFSKKYNGDVNFFQKYRQSTVYQCIFFLFYTIISVLAFRLWQKYKSYRIVYAIILYSILLAFIAKSLAILADFFVMPNLLSDFYFLTIPVWNILILVICFKWIGRPQSFSTFLLWFFFIFLTNFVLWDVKQDRFNWFFHLFFIDGVMNRFGATILSSFFTTLIGFRALFMIRKAPSSFSFIGIIKLIFYLIVTGVLFSILSYLANGFYTYWLFRLVPEIALFEHDYSKIGFFFFLKVVTISDLTIMGLFDYYLVFLSPFVPLSLYLSILILGFLSKKMKKKSGIWVFYLYTFSSGKSNIGSEIIPWYLIAVFISFISSVATGFSLYFAFRPAV